jgi:AraC family transcriptional regulator of adaptative response/methylated-DNA-[protein]-cysteine methyltransferase
MFMPMTQTREPETAGALVGDEDRWEAVRRRDPAFDGKLIFAVRTTGVYCRPSCASRPAKRENVVFFNTPAEAEMAGYRACKRCRPDKLGLPDPQIEASSGRAIESSPPMKPRSWPISRRAQA